MARRKTKKTNAVKISRKRGVQFLDSYTNRPKHFAYPVSIKKDIFASTEIQALISDETFATELYASLCNILWTKTGVSVSETYRDEITALLAANKTYTFDDSTGFSFRGSAEVVADLRNMVLATSENYMDWYCSSSEGNVSERVSTAMANMGWKHQPYT